MQIPSKPLCFSQLRDFVAEFYGQKFGIISEYDLAKQNSESMVAMTIMESTAAHNAPNQIASLTQSRPRNLQQ